MLVLTRMGEKVFQSPGSHIRASVVTMMTKRSNHMPTFTHIATIITTHRLSRQALNQKNCGEMHVAETSSQQ